MKLNFIALNETFAVCKLPPNSDIPNWIYNNVFYSITHTPDELSLVCIQDTIPAEVRAEKDWKVFKVAGPLDFSLVGILSNISNTLAKSEISIFAISTFDTDYVLVKKKDYEKAKKAFVEQGHTIKG